MLRRARVVEDPLLCGFACVGASIAGVWPSVIPPLHGKRVNLSASRRQRGFTLLEILVVVVIIGILTALMLPNLSSGGRWRELQRETQTLTARIRVAQDDAMLYGREFGLVFTEREYRFVHWDAANSAFVDLEPAEPWAVRTLDEGIEISAASDSTDPILVLPEPDESEAAETVDAGSQPKEKPKTYAPSVYVLSSGEVTPFTAVFRAEGEEQTVELRIDAMGNRVVDESSGQGGSGG